VLGALSACNVRIATGIGIAILIFNRGFQVKKALPCSDKTLPEIEIPDSAQRSQL